MEATGETSAQMALRDPDIRLMLRVRADEPGAFEELVNQFQHRLVAVMHHVVGDATEAEDLAQEAFLRVYRARKKYRPRSKFSTWLFTIANNLALNSLRSASAGRWSRWRPPIRGRSGRGRRSNWSATNGAGRCRKCSGRNWPGSFRRRWRG